MITPNKATPLKESIIFKTTYVLDVEFESINIEELYKKTKNKFETINEFIYSLDVLYILNKIEIDFDTGFIRKC
ncbi:hypothetical protein C9J22_17535 [Photobacterium phosphoreum]|uniref:ABC-three component system middle component 7 n=1 Tax=Photobacterium phosphoreum TaxID=659 RepID=UPI000D166FEA|nr:ABC-three component system middle component 7 [Photobacterium phosphoreum]PSU68279.1 hypothetical protein C9J22_17535 [Photobacterium phosphoreum]